MRRSLAFGQMSASRAPDITPRVLGWDEPSLLMVFELIDDAAGGGGLELRQWTGTGRAFIAGSAVGVVHEMPAPDAGISALMGGGPPPLPSAALLRGLPLPMFRSCSAGELKAWRLMQRDAALAAAVDRLLAQSERAPRVPAHCDLRLDQFLFPATRELPYLVDWEEFRLEDPARDVGSCAGEWLHRAVTRRTGPVPAAPSHDDIMRHYEDGIEQARPVISAFWRGYREARPDHDPGLAARATAFAGWHMYDRLLAGARYSIRLDAVDRAAAGIGRALMEAPGAAARTIGLNAS